MNKDRVNPSAVPGRIVLTGFMGTGKSTAGRVLAEQLGLRFVDTDDMIEAAHGPIPDLFRNHGEAHFRALEHDTAVQLARETGVVVATGGRLMLDAANAAALGSDATVVALTADIDTILARVSGDGDAERPLLAGDDPRAAVVELFAERADGYARFPTVHTTGLSPAAVAAEVMDLVVDHEAMRAAMRAASRVRSATSPNPWVGAALIDRDGLVVATGATEPPGGRHAEIVALDAASAAGLTPADLTLATTLEPCSHHGRTPPCSQAIVAAGVRRVVVGVLDPDPQVAGEGISHLRAAGVEVTVGVAAVDVEEQLAAYLHHRRTGRPFVVAKLAVTADGATAAPDATSQWITGPAARRDGHQLRADSDAILVGAGTVRADDPALTVRLVEGPDPRRVVLGSAPPGARVHPCLEWSGELADLLDHLGGEGVVQLMVEGGPTVLGSFHRAGLVDRYVSYVAPALLGGDDGLPSFAGAGAPSVEQIWRGRFVSVSPVGNDLRIEIAPID